MTVTFVSNDRLDPAINWSTLGPPFRSGMQSAGATIVTPELGLRGARQWPRSVRAARRTDAVFWLQLNARPELPVLAAAAGARRKSAWVADAWPYAIPKIGRAATLLRLDPCFVAFREGVDAMRTQFPSLRVEHLPFGVDTSVFRPRTVSKDIFAFWMGRKHEPLHNALTAYCNERGLTYLSSGGGRITDPQELGELVSRSRYFVVTTPDVDHPERAGGFSPFVMRYLEGLAANTRLLGTRPRSGELEDMRLQDGLLEVAADGSDLEARLEADKVAMSHGVDVLEEIGARVREEHSWAARARHVTAILSR